MSRFLPLTLFSLLLAGSAAGEGTVFAQANVPYGQAGANALRLDLCVPSGPGPFAGVILVHGGGWAGGDKEKDPRPLLAPLTNAGFAWFSINYRLAPRYRYPACLDDVYTAIRWVKAHAAEYGGDPARIALLGHSAGGHLVCFQALAAAGDARVQAVVGCAPVTDLIEDSLHRGGLSVSLQHLFGLPGDLTGQVRPILAAASPINRVAPGAPPFLLIQGDADRTVPLYQTLAFEAKLASAGVPCRLIVIKGAPHSMVTWDKIDPSYKDEMIGWLEATLAGARRPGARAEGESRAAHP